MNKKSIISYNSLFWLTCFLLLALPLHSSNKILSYLTLFNNFTIFHAAFLVLSLFLIAGFIFQREKITKYYIFPCFFLIVIFISFIVGLGQNYNPADTLADFCYYFLTGLILFSYQSSRVKKKNIHELMLFSNKAITVSCCISLLMFFTKDFSFWGLVSFNGGRYFGGNLSLLIVTIPYLYYCYLHKKGISFKKLLFSTSVGLSCMILSQSRASFFMIALSCAIILIIDLFKNQTKDTLAKKICSIILIAIFVAIFFSLDLPVVKRLLGNDTTDSYGTLSFRTYLYQGYLPEIANSLFGKGFGAPMFFYNENLQIAIWTETLAVDSTFITAGYKGGIILLLCYAIMFLSVCSHQIRMYFVSKNMNYLAFLIVFILFFVSTSIITAQTIHTFTINAFLALSFASSRKELFSRRRRISNLDLSLNKINN